MGHLTEILLVVVTLVLALVTLANTIEMEMDSHALRKIALSLINRKRADSENTSEDDE